MERWELTAQLISLVAANGWIDPARKYLFITAGYGVSGNFNDLWVFNYDTSSMQWAWVDGTSIVNSGGFYSALGTPHTRNIYAARNSS